jgi:hypothetical protein
MVTNYIYLYVITGYCQFAARQKMHGVIYSQL